MPNNKKQRNGFFYFMREVREDEAARGNHFSNMLDLQKFVDPLWKELTAEEKLNYNLRAKNEKQNAAADNERKYNSLGQSFAAVEAIDREKEEAQKVMKATIRNAIQSSSHEAVARKPFYFCHVNYYYVQNQKDYQPAEIAIAEFTLVDGIIDTLHYILHPGTIPLGVKGDAANWAEKTHGIRLRPRDDDAIERQENFVQVFSNVVRFLKKNAGIHQGTMVLPVIYSMPDSLNNNTSLSAVESCMSFLSHCAHEQPDLFRIYPLPELFFNLRKKWASNSSDIPTVAILENEIEKDVFSFAADLGCSYHEAKDLSVHCSLAMVKRWVYTVCDHICQLADVEIIPGQHAPSDVDTSWSKVHSTKKLNPKAEAKYFEPPEDKPAPRFVDLPKMQERRIREKQAVDEEISQAKNLPLPMKAVYRGGPTNPPGLPRGLQDDDFPPIGGKGGGRGLALPKVGPGAWPISGRGKPAK